jgi:DNA-directed RNA polymerase subunit M/transcription elongation factor TFIIS
MEDRRVRRRFVSPRRGEVFEEMSSYSRSDESADEETCSNCGHTGEPVVYEQRVDHADPTNTVAVLAQCGECGYPL